MTGPDDTNSNTRPISVAELLARNGTIGAPPLGGRRRRRRGDTGSITVAELTGEIPIIRPDDTAETVTEAAPDTEAVETNGAVDQEAETAEDTAEAETAEDTDVAEAAELTEDIDVAEDEDEDAEDVDDDYADAVADYAAYVEHREKDEDLDFFAPPRRSSAASSSTAEVGAEQMSPDPVLDWADTDTESDDADLETEQAETAVAEDDDELPSYLRSTDGPLFGGQTVADDLARGGARPGPEDIDLDDHEDQEGAEAPAGGRMSSILRAAWVVGQCVIAVAFGAGLFIAFDQLWKWNNIVALMLSVLVILGLVVGVRVVRKTEDIGSTLIAVAVGALVTLGPLALLQSG
ncbi:hypothetical protein [Mycolicibacterium pulveris]|uniref:hypothetical protein n=1 Tax=Mycolicibacterium pulveris TaxID=36813 RepID=UPI003CED4539